MSNTQIQFILKMIPINQAVDKMISTMDCLGEDFKFDNDTRIKLAVIYNNF
jgi:hypothetical protein